MAPGVKIDRFARGMRVVCSVLHSCASNHTIPGMCRGLRSQELAAKPRQIREMDALWLAAHSFVVAKITLVLF